MAFAQRHRRPTHSASQPPLPSSDSEDSYAILHTRGYAKSTLQRRQSNGLAAPSIAGTATSDSDNDWHVISGNCAIQHNNALLSSPQWTPSEPESVSAVAYADSESMVSDLDTHTDSGKQQFSFLPAHDGTGTFADIGGFVSDSSMGSASMASRHTPIKIKAQTADFQPVSSSMPNILLPDGGIAPPTFTGRQTQTSDMPDFVPTMAGRSWREFRQIFSSEEDDGSLSENDAVWRKRHQKSAVVVDEDDSYQSESTTTNISSDETKRRRMQGNKDLDSIPTHHPSLPGSATSAAIIHTVWRNLRRLTTHIIENDTTTSDTLGTLVSEATLEGCLPFGSHLHMDFSTGNLSNNKDFSLSGSRFDHHIGHQFTG
ncbi:hypothetical protein INT43_003787 [Umbelopsis isabellina]|uniref:Uncharacterized protein n=1 Tax=Mortierella isabellina TaxID=91625 RepID=A0A8H7PUI8_MORIS|nr:hypothetical protein INT43_003787 [Umbelopsis isabellina]